MSANPDRGAERLLALGPIGFLLALVLGHHGHLSKIPLAIGGVGGMIGLTSKLMRRETEEEAI